MPIITNPNIPLDNKQLRVYDENGTFTRVSVDEAIARGYNSWKGWKCSAGVRNLYIDYDGNVWNANCASSNRNASAHYKTVQKNIRDKWKEYRESIIGADNTEERANWIRENVGPEHWPMPKTDWENCPAQLAIMSEISRLEKLFFSEEFSKKATGADLHSNEWKWESTLDDIPSNWGLLGNIREGIDIPEEYTTCPFSHCGCGADVILSKAKSKDYISLLDVTHNGYAGTQRAKKFTDSINNNVAVEMNFPIPYQILWDISRRCNYSCDYCWPAVHSKTDPFPSKEAVFNTIDMIIDHWSNGKEIRWNFGGGEPTMHEDFIDIMKHLKNKNQWILVTTNGSRSTKFWREAAKYINSVNMSAHFASMDLYKGNEDRFVENCKIIMEHHDAVDDDHWLEIKLMTPPGYLERAEALRDKILALDMLHKPGANNRPKGSLSLVPIRDINDAKSLVEYSQNEIEFFRKQ